MTHKQYVEIDNNLSLEESLFYRKNKAYGAYVLRQRQQLYLLLSWLLSTVIILAAYVYPSLMRNSFTAHSSAVEVRQVAVNITPMPQQPQLENVEPVLPPQETAQKAPLQVATKKYVKPLLRPDEEVKNEELIPTVDELKNANPGIETREGSKDLYQIYDPKAKGDTGTASGPATSAPAKKEEIFSIVQKQPEFPGGMAAFQQFLKENLVYPQKALDNDISGTVVVQFVVDRQGNITQPVVLKDIGYGCGEEALRVVSLMPRWIPGEQGGQKVSVRYTLPIRFKLVHTN